MSRLHIRGLMGVQILQAAVALSKENDDDDDTVLCINNEKSESLSEHP